MKLLGQRQESLNRFGCVVILSALLTTACGSSKEFQQSEGKAQLPSVSGTGQIIAPADEGEQVSQPVAMPIPNKAPDSIPIVYPSPNPAPANSVPANPAPTNPVAQSCPSNAGDPLRTVVSGFRMKENINPSADPYVYAEVSVASSVRVANRMNLHFGCVLSEVGTGRLMWTGDDLQGTAAKGTCGTEYSYAIFDGNGIGRTDFFNSIGYQCGNPYLSPDRNHPPMPIAGRTYEYKCELHARCVLPNAPQENLSQLPLIERLTGRVIYNGSSFQTVSETRQRN